MTCDATQHCARRPQHICMHHSAISAGYSSAYYTYMWDKVIAEDFYAQFNSKDPFADNTPMRYRQQVLEPGGSKSANDLVKAFVGRPQNMTAFKSWMNEEFAASPAQPQ
jgi:thimet oligopeptidase